MYVYRRRIWTWRLEFKNLNGAVCISLRNNTVGKGRNRILLPPPPDVIWLKIKQTRLFNLGMATRLQEGKLNSNLINSV